MPLIEATTRPHGTGPGPVTGPAISVVVCTFADARRQDLLAALESLRQQTVAPGEVIVVVDHNPDLLRWIRDRERADIAMRNRFQRGLSGARNSGVQAASGDVIAFLDDDAVADPAWIESLSAQYADEQVLGAGGAVLPIWERRPGWFPEEFAWVVGCTYRGLPSHRSAVRNFIGCNMSFRREVFEQLEGFTTLLGRVGSKPLGCEETELCIRIGRHAPDRTLLFDPEITVHHRVPADRSTLRYFLSRCYSEGISKAEVARIGGNNGLSSERSYALRTLPAGVWLELRTGVSGTDANALRRAGAIVIGFLATASGFAVASRPRLRNATAAPEPSTMFGSASNGSAMNGSGSNGSAMNGSGSNGSAMNGSAIAGLPSGTNGGAPESFSATTAISVVVATCGRPAGLARCLNSLLTQSRLPERIVVVDDDPGGEDSARAMAECSLDPRIVYVEGEGRGLGAAHNRGLLEVDTPLVAFTDDDVVAHESWLEQLIDAFTASPEVGCVTGMIEPLELETPEQIWLEAYAGFNKGAARQIFNTNGNRPDDPLFPFTAGSLGSGANMAFSRSALEEIGGFDPALGAGTVARGADDLSAFVEVLLGGYSLVYEPGAMVQHCHPRTPDALRRQVYSYGVGLTAYLTKCLVDRPRLIASFARLLPRAAAHALDSDSARNARRPADYPRDLIWRERLGMLAGPVAYLRSRRRAAKWGQR